MRNLLIYTLIMILMLVIILMLLFYFIHALIDKFRARKRSSKAARQTHTNWNNKPGSLNQPPPSNYNKAVPKTEPPRPEEGKTLPQPGQPKEPAKASLDLATPQIPPPPAGLLDKPVEAPPSKTREEQLESQLLEDPSHFFWKKDSCMTPNESRMFYYINCALDELLPPEKRRYFQVFPQVSLYSFIGIKSKSLLDDELNAARRYFLSKNADFVICRYSWKKQYNSGNNKMDYQFCAYTPVLVIELDGHSHSSAEKYGEEQLLRQQKSDAFKDALGEGLNIPLIRYTLENDKISKQDRMKIKEKIAGSAGGIIHSF